MGEETNKPSDSVEDKKKDTVVESVETEEANVSSGDPEVIVDEAGTETPKPKNRKPLIIAIVCIVVILVACLATFLVLNEKNKQAHAPIAISFSFEAPGYDSQTGSGIPLHIEGADLDNKTVSETLLVDAGSPGLELLRGSYDITVAGSPVTGDGGIYAVPDSATHIEINEDNVTINGESFSLNQSEGSPIELPVVVFTAIKPQDVTDEQIAAVKTWMSEVDFSQETIDKFTDLITANRKAGIAKAEEEKLAAWRTKITGTYFGTGIWLGGPDPYSISFSISDNKLVVRGHLEEQGTAYSKSPTGPTETHFLLTDKTTYSQSGDFTNYLSKTEFINEHMPDKFVAMSITVQDGYVTNMDTHA